MKKLLVLAVLILTLTLVGCVSTKIGVMGTVTNIEYKEECFMTIFCAYDKFYTVAYNGKEYIVETNIGRNVSFEIGDDYLLFVSEDEVAD